MCLLIEGASVGAGEGSAAFATAAQDCTEAGFTVELVLVGADTGVVAVVAVNDDTGVDMGDVVAGIGACAT